MLTVRPSRPRRTALAVGAAALLLLGAAGCSSDGGGEPKTPTATASPSPASSPSPTSPVSPSKSPTATASPSATGTASGSAAAGQVTVTIKNFLFNPATFTVAPGAKITVTNQDSAGHTLTAINKEFDTGLLEQGQSATITAPSAPGSYAYHCDIHPNMTGTLVVQ
ncbi:cupredoxin family copper-binding protein [Kitasatospora sp. CM 4170]|uniref:Cupredoxin family copper-binding protein n=1 Tax=Kitasatospora aburaviensis TaxID=67265 RepID=A0ABW1ET92_9ACTN|nr:cupredoxin family copper-binding protein [Kitasatospora sp. CM 4170]WNM45236.1 cupredoxin family copper-binding protein [Kitasatospora sp. CM 4170]